MFQSKSHFAGIRNKILNNEIKILCEDKSPATIPAECRLANDETRIRVRVRDVNKLQGRIPAGVVSRSEIKKIYSIMSNI